MTVRTKSEQKAYLDGYEMCAECIERYLSNEGKKKLESLLMAVRYAVEIEDIEPQESELSQEVDTVKKYQKIQEIVTKWQSDPKMKFDTSYYNMAKILEVLEDGNDD